MQTFLPYPSFEQTAKCLDKKRLFKQVVEARQVLATLGCDVRKNDGEPYKSSHPNHPAHKMWAGYTNALKLYHNVLLRECLVLGFNTEMTYLCITGPVTMPPWLGDEAFHSSHRSSLKRKSDFYAQYDWFEPDDLEYVWPIP